jgi:hypothetical protein
MPVAAIADPTAALNAYLRSFSEITALVSSAAGYTDDATTAQKARPRISTTVQPFWRMPAEAILIRRRSGPAPDRDGRLRTSRFDLWYFGYGGAAQSVSRQERAAFALWRQTQPILCPTHGQSTRFVQAGCLVTGIEEEADPFPFDDQATGWRVIVGPILCRWVEQVIP